MRALRELAVRLRRSLVPVTLLGLGAALFMALAPATLQAAPPAARTAPPGAKGKTAAAPSDPEVVARVNGRPILRRDFDLAVQIQFRGRRQSVGLKELQAVRDKVLERLIDNEVLYQKAVRSEAAVGDQEIEAEFGKMKQGFPSASDFDSTLKRSGVTEAEFKDQLRRTLLVTRFVEKEVVGDVTISDEEVRRYYDQHPAEMIRHESVHLAQILVRAAPEASRESRDAARQKIEEILKEVRSGGEFAEVARKYSEGPEASRGGDTGWIARGKGPPALEKSAFDLQPGQMSDVVISRLGFHILKLLEKRPEGPIPFEDVQEKIRARLAARERQEKISVYVTRLKEQARVERALKTTS